MNFPAYIAKRYLHSKSSQSAVNIINFFTFLVIIIGAAALFLVLSAFAGLKIFSLQFSNVFDPDLKAVPEKGKFFSLSESEMNALNEIPGIASWSNEIVERVYLSFDDKSCIAYIKGVDHNYQAVTQIDSTLSFGYWGLEQEESVIGLGIFNALGGPVGSRSPVTAITLKPGARSITTDALQANSFYNQAKMNVTGIYAVEEAIDKKYIFAALPRVQAFLEKEPNTFSGINFKLNRQDDIKEVRSSIEAILGQKTQLLDRQALNGTLHKMLKTENTATYLIFTLVLIIALFNVVGAIIMLILDKRENSKTLYAMGTTVKQLRKIYFIQGALVTLSGGIVGLLLGSIIVWLQLEFQFWRITPSLPYPVAFKWGNIGIVLITIIVLGLLASKIASGRISKKLLA
ncbi:MAG: FtsX-like permease family protein [Bacteroidota bacterium]